MSCLEALPITNLGGPWRFLVVLISRTR